MKKFDVIVIGAGAGGMTSALYASRANLSTLMLDRGLYGGQMNNTSDIEDYPGYPKIFGAKLAKAMFKGSVQFGAHYKYGSIKKITYQKNASNHYNFTVVTDMHTYQSKVVIIATGSNYKKLGVPGEKQYSGAGVSYCAVCDGNFFKDQPIAVVGGGDSAFTEALYLSHIVSNVKILIRKDQPQAQQVLQDKVLNNSKIQLLFNTQVEKINGNGKALTNLDLDQNGQSKELDVKGLFVYIGNIPNTKEFANLHVADSKGWIKTDQQMRTRIPGLFAVGDVREKHLRQIATAVGDGGIAGQNSYNYIENL